MPTNHWGAYLFLSIMTMHGNALASTEGTYVFDGFESNYVPPSVVKQPGFPTDYRMVQIYLPPNYDQSSETYPVVYFFHGWQGDYARFPGLKYIFDEALSLGIIVPMIAVKVDGSRPWLIPSEEDLLDGDWYVNTTTLSTAFEDYLIKELIPYIDTKYRTKKISGDGKAYRAAMGQSMGGYGSLFFGLRYPDYFSAYASDSGTPFWVIITSLANADPLYFIKQLVLPELRNTPPVNEAVVTSSVDRPFTNYIFSWANSLSPNALHGSYPYGVDLPFLVDYAHSWTVIFSNPGDPESIIADNTTIAQWQAKDPYNDITIQTPTARKQTIYLDGGDVELINAVGAQYFSQQLINNDIEHEYILYQGNHITCLEDFYCSRFLTNLQRFSAHFAAAGVYADDVRAKLCGTIHITLQNQAQWNIPDQCFFGIENVEGQGVTTTDISLEINDAASLTIGTATTNGGALQIGDRFNKACLAYNPARNTYSVSFSLLVNGPQATIQIGKHGFFGWAVGVDGMNPSMPNYWSVSSLVNVTSIGITLTQGIFSHACIASGDEDRASLLALGPAHRYTWQANNATIQGGGNILLTTDSYKKLPTVQTTVIPTETSDLNDDAAGIRSEIDPDYPVNDAFYNKPQGSKTFYYNRLACNMLASSPLLDQTSLSTTNAQDLLNLIAIPEYFTEQANKKAAISQGTTFGQTKIGFTIKQLPAVGEETIIEREQLSAIPGATALDLTKVQNAGSVGITVVQRNGAYVPLRVYDLNPAP